MSSTDLRQAGISMGNTFSAVNTIFAEAPNLNHVFQVFGGWRDDTHIGNLSVGLLRPAQTYAVLQKPQESLPGNIHGINLPISSRNNLRVTAFGQTSKNDPHEAQIAPVNALFSWPNNSLSHRSSAANGAAV